MGSWYDAPGGAANSVSDTDTLLVNQNGVSRTVTRGQLLDGVQLTWQGEWVNTRGYKRNNAMRFNGSVYYCTTPTNPGESPLTNPDKWQLLSSKGDKGELAVITVNTVTPVTPAAVRNEGTTTEAELEFDIPRGTAVLAGNVTTVTPATPAAAAMRTNGDGDKLLDLSIPRGSTVAVGNVTTGAAGSAAAAAIRTDGNGDKLLDLTIPTGLTGSPYKAYTTLAAANADLANIPANALVWINNDAGTPTNNGYWAKLSGVLVQSPNDPVTSLRAYVDVRVTDKLWLLDQTTAYTTDELSVIKAIVGFKCVVTADGSAVNDVYGVAQLSFQDAAHPATANYIIIRNVTAGTNEIVFNPATVNLALTEYKGTANGRSFTLYVDYRLLPTSNKIYVNTVTPRIQFKNNSNSIPLLLDKVFGIDASISAAVAPVTTSVTNLQNYVDAQLPERGWVSDKTVAFTADERSIVKAVIGFKAITVATGQAATNQYRLTELAYGHVSEGNRVIVRDVTNSVNVLSLNPATVPYGIVQHTVIYNGVQITLYVDYRMLPVSGKTYVNDTNSRINFKTSNNDVPPALEQVYNLKASVNGPRNASWTTDSQGRPLVITETAAGVTAKTTTLAYTGDALSTVTEVENGVTTTTTITYDTKGNVTGYTQTAV